MTFPSMHIYTLIRSNMKFKKFNLSDGTFIRYQNFGKGPPILLLHTFRNRLEYSFQISNLIKDNYSVYLLDLPGFGDSPINSTTIYNEQFFTKSLVEFIKSQNLKSLTIAGESIGGVLPVTICLEIPKIVKKILLFNPYDYDTYFGEGIARGNFFSKFILFHGSLPFLGSFFSSLENKFILKNIMRGGFYDIENLSEEYLKLLCSSLKKENYTYHFRNVLRNSKTWAATKSFYTKIKIPVKLIYGNKDWSTKKERRETADLLKVNDIIEIDDCGHFSFLDQPKKVADILLS